MAVEWSPNDWSNILTVGAAALCSLLMVLFKSRCSKISLCWGIFSCNRVVKDDDDEPASAAEAGKPEPKPAEPAPEPDRRPEDILPAQPNPPPQVPELQVNP